MILPARPLPLARLWGSGFIGFKVQGRPKNHKVHCSHGEQPCGELLDAFVAAKVCLGFRQPTYKEIERKSTW